MEFEYCSSFFDISDSKTDPNHFVLASFWGLDRYWSESCSDAHLSQKFVASLNL